MLEYLLIGAGFAFAATWQPGPFQAFLLTRIAAVGWRRTLPAAFAPLISDGPIALVVLLTLREVPRSMETILQAAGGLVLLWFAFQAGREWRRAGDVDSQRDVSAPRTLGQAVLVNVLNPSPWIGWSLVLGPLAIEAWRQSAGHAVALVGGFYATFFLGLVTFIMLLGATGWLRPRARRGLHLLAALALAGLGLYRLATAFL